MFRTRQVNHGPYIRPDGAARIKESANQLTLPFALSLIRAVLSAGKSAPEYGIWHRASGTDRDLHPVDRHVLLGADFYQVVTVADGVRGDIVRVPLTLVAGNTV